MALTLLIENKLVKSKLPLSMAGLSFTWWVASNCAGFFSILAIGKVVFEKINPLG